MLALANAHGEVLAAAPGLARVANVTLQSCEAAILKFESKDPYSRTPDNDGRRIEKIVGGWRILNYQLYRDMMSQEDRRAYQREWDRQNRPLRPNSLQRKAETPDTTPDNPRENPTKTTQAEAEAEAEAEKDRQIGAPSLEQVKTRAQFVGMPENEAVAFWNHFEASGWIDKNGNPIKRWEPKMDNWKITAQARPIEVAHKNGESRPRPKTPYELKTIMEAKKAIAERLKNQHSSESAMGVNWQDQSKRLEYVTLRKEIKALEAQLAGMA